MTVPAALLGGTVLIARGSSGPGDGPGPEAESPAAQAPPHRSIGRPAARSCGDDPAGLALRDVLPVAAKTADPYSVHLRARSAWPGPATPPATARRPGRVPAGRPGRRYGEGPAPPPAGDDAHGGRPGEAGRHRAARATLDHFAREAAGLEARARYNLMSMVIDFLGDAGFKAEAVASLKAELAAFDALANESLKDGGIYRLIYNQATIGDYDGALRQVERYTGERSNYRQSLLDIIVRYTSTIPGRFAPRQVVERRSSCRARSPIPPARWPRPRSPRHLPAPATSTGHSRLARDIGKDAAEFKESIRAEIPAALAEIARIQAKGGDLDGARKTLREAWALSRTVTRARGVLFDRVRRIAEAAAEIGDVEAAGRRPTRSTATRRRRPSPWWRWPAPGEGRRRQGRAGDARRGPEARPRHRPPGQLHQRQPRRKRRPGPPRGRRRPGGGRDAEGAVATVASRGSAAWKSKVLAAIAPIQARQGDIPAPWRRFGPSPKRPRPAESYCEIASIQARKDGAEAALAWAGRLEPPVGRMP